jgi:hypothetical protein
LPPRLAETRRSADVYGYGNVRVHGFLTGLGAGYTLWIVLSFFEDMDEATTPLGLLVGVRFCRAGAHC